MLGLDDRIRHQILERYDVSALLRSWFHHARENFRTYIVKTQNSSGRRNNSRADNEENDEYESPPRPADVRA
jgi:hypothetical protein